MKQLKFKKMISNSGRSRWDADAGGGKFYRILPSNGWYALYACEGLEINGVTPKKMTLLKECRFLRYCKIVAQNHANPPVPKPMVSHNPYNSGERVQTWLPYKD